MGLDLGLGAALLSEERVWVAEGFWIGGGGCLNSCQSFRKSRESEFPPTEESGLQTPPTEDNHTLPFPEEIHVDVVSLPSTPSYFYC